MSFATLRYRVDAGVAWLVLDRPQAHNALNLAMRDDLWTALDLAEADDDVRVLVFAGEGPSFSAGADVTEFGTTPSLHLAREARRQRDLWWRMERFPKAMVAALHGWVLGAGLELSLYCDLRVAAEDVRIGLPEVRLGYIPSAGGTQTVSRTAGRAAALELALTGEPISAHRALEIGLVSGLVPAGEQRAGAERAARALLLKSPLALRYARESIRAGCDLPLEAALALEQRLVSTLARAEHRHTG